MASPFLLIGMLDSPFVRRVAVVLRRYCIPYENLALRTVGDAEEFAKYSPLKRAPTLILPSGVTLVDSQLIIDTLDESAPAHNHLMPVDPTQRLTCRKVLGIAGGLADKAVSGVYEKSFHPPGHRSEVLLQRIFNQLTETLSWLNEHAPEREFLLGAKLCHADVLFATAVCFALEAHPDVLDLSGVPLARGWFERVSALPELKETYLALEPPAP